MVLISNENSFCKSFGWNAHSLRLFEFLFRLGNFTLAAIVQKPSSVSFPDAMVDDCRAQLGSAWEIHLGWCLPFERSRLGHHIFSLEISVTETLVKVHLKMQAIYENNFFIVHTILCKYICNYCSKVFVLIYCTNMFYWFPQVLWNKTAIQTNNNAVCWHVYVYIYIHIYICIYIKTGPAGEFAVCIMRIKLFKLLVSM